MKSKHIAIIIAVTLLLIGSLTTIKVIIDKNEEDDKEASEERSETRKEKEKIELRNTSRSSDILQILNAVTFYQSREENQPIPDLPICPESQEIGTASDDYDLREYLVPDYIDEIPEDPLKGSSKETGYHICRSENNRITITGIHAENGATLTVRR